MRRLILAALAALAGLVAGAAIAGAYWRWWVG